MSRTFIIGALAALATFSATRAYVCDEVTDLLDLDNALLLDGADVEVTLPDSVTTVECPAIFDNSDDLAEVVLSDSKLTIKSSNIVRFTNLRFTVEDGAHLVFDMPKTKFGPTEDIENAGGFMIDVKEGGSVTFEGAFAGWRVLNVRSMFYNSGTIEFNDDAHFQRNGNVFRSNEGSIKFRGKTTFRENFYLAIDNEGPDAFVRFADEAVFIDNAGSFNGASGCGVSNAEGTVIFREDVYFADHGCDEGAAVFNGGKMRFYGKAKFVGNRNFGDYGAGVTNNGGTLVFKKAARFRGNRAVIGGGLAVTGGEVTFNKAVLFSMNNATETGGAFAVTNGPQFGFDNGPGSLTFKKPLAVRYRFNRLENRNSDNEPITGCALAYVEEGTTLEGFLEEDVCHEETV